MKPQEIEKSLGYELSILNTLRAQYDTKRAFNLSEIERSCSRRDGSERQDRMHDEHMDKCRDDEQNAERAMDEQQKIVSMLAEKYVKATQH